MMSSLFPTTGTLPLCPSTLNPYTSPAEYIQTQRSLSFCTTSFIRVDSHTSSFHALTSRLSSSRTSNSSPASPLPRSTPILSKTPMKMLNFLQAGFKHADLLLTVSPGFATEVKSGAKKGVEFAEKKNIVGILNGADIETWNPAKDKFIPYPYSVDTIETKALNKAALQEALGLLPLPTAPVISFVGRLEDQKGYDCVLEVLPYIVNDLKAQVIMMGQGKEANMQKLKKLETTFPGFAKGITQVGPQTEHLMMAGSDYILMPSRFEPCGLVQLHGMRYGAIPIVSKTGGLKDSVPPECGFQIEEVPSPEYPGMKISKELLAAGAVIVKEGVTAALKEYDTETFKQQRQTCMKKDFGWGKKVLLYEKYFLDLKAAPDGVSVAA
mmetsp:Transcript_7250/g.11995  ORF Transcript_7250/g.11995 Transcript_7250/m.11995 type:complete len:382 (-) Transcript_7250:151-1296(-)